MKWPHLDLAVVAGGFVVTRHDRGTPTPSWVDESTGLVSVTSTADAVSIVCADELAPADMPRSGPWSALRVRGPLDHALVGILASIAVPLAEAGIPIFAVSTYDTDYVLVPAGQLEAACRALRAGGHDVLDE